MKKARILFVYRNVLGVPYIDFGIASLSAFLKSKGHTTELIDYTFGMSDEKAALLALDFRPDVLCFSSRSNEFGHIVRTATLIKEQTGALAFCGGPHPTIAPEDALRDCFDGVCLGEGELALLELVEKICKGKDYTSTKNFWFRRGGKIIKNPVRPLIQDLDTLPLFDYGLFNMKKYMEARDGQIDYMTARGCPFRCSYCINHVLQNLYIGKGKYIRAKSIPVVREELKYLKKTYNFRNIFINDEIFNLDAARMKEFSRMYAKEIVVPFECCARADMCTDENMGYLKDANCAKLCIAIESGDEKFRKEVLNKNISDEKILEAFRLAKKHGIHTMSYNMIGLPMEKPEQIEKTIDINRRAQSDSIQVSTFIPFFGTELYDYCKKNNLLLDGKMGISYYFGTYLKNPNLTQKQLERYRRTFSYRCYRDRSLVKANMLLVRDMVIPYYLKYGSFIPVRAKKMIYRFFWNTKLLKFMGK